MIRKIFICLLICLALSSCSAADSNLSDDFSENSGYAYVSIGDVSTDYESLSVMMLDEFDYSYYRYTSLGDKKSDNVIVNYTDNISYYNSYDWSEELSLLFTNLVNENLVKLNDFFNIDSFCEVNNTTVFIEELVVDGNVNDEMVLIELFVPYVVTYSGEFSVTEVVYVKVFNYVVVVSDGYMSLNGIEYEYSSFVDSHNILK